MNSAPIFQFYLFLLATLMVVSIGFFLFLSYHKQKQAENKLLRQQLEFDHSNALLHARIDIHEQSMALVSDELHDNLAQIMTVAGKYMELAYVKMEDGSARDLVSRSIALFGTLVTKMRNVSHSLSNDMLHELGLLVSSERLMESMEHLGISSSFETTGTPVPLEKEKELLIFRILQEFIQNVIKHAQAKRFYMAFHYHAASLAIEVRDDGNGFDPDLLEAGGHLGLISIRNRVSLLHAHMHLETGKGKGCFYKLNIPLNTQNER